MGDVVTLAKTDADSPQVSAAQRIIHAAIAELGEKGFAATTMKDVAARAGASKQLVYHYFENKNELFSAAVDEVSRQNHWKLFNTDFTSLPPVEAVQRFFGVIVEICASTHRLVFAEHLLACEIGWKGTRETKRTGHRVYAILDEIVHRGKAEGVIDPRVNTRQLLMQMVLLTFGWSFFNPMLSSYLGEDLVPPEATADWEAHARASILAAIEPGRARLSSQSDAA